MIFLRLPANWNYQREADSDWRPNDALFPFSSHQTVTSRAAVRIDCAAHSLWNQWFNGRREHGAQFAKWFEVLPFKASLCNHSNRHRIRHYRVAAIRRAPDMGIKLAPSFFLEPRQRRLPYVRRGSQVY